MSRNIKFELATLTGNKANDIEFQCFVGNFLEMDEERRQILYSVAHSLSLWQREIDDDDAEIKKLKINGSCI